MKWVFSLGGKEIYCTIVYNAPSLRFSLNNESRNQEERVMADCKTEKKNKTGNDIAWALEAFDWHEYFFYLLN